MYRLRLPAERADAAVSAGAPATHLRRGKTGAIASCEFRFAYLHQAKNRSIHDRGRVASLIFNRLKLDMAHVADADFRAITPAQLDRRAFGRKPFRDKTPKHCTRSALLSGENPLELLALPRICPIVYDQADGRVATSEILGQIDEPHDGAA